jgi:hypothetical protein
MKLISTGPVPKARVRGSKNHSGEAPLQEKFRLKRDYYAGALMLVLGVGWVPDSCR